LRQPHAANENDFEVFDKDYSGVKQGFPNEEVLVLTLPKHCLDPLPGYNDDLGLCMLSAEVLAAFRPRSFGGVVDNKPWMLNQILLPPRCIIRSFYIMDKAKQVATKGADNKARSRSKSPPRDRTRNKAGQSSGTEIVTHATLDGKQDIMPLDSIMKFTSEMTKIRSLAAKSNLIPLYHYTSPSVAPLILSGGLRMSTQGQGDGGVYVSTQGPALYGLGTSEYEVNIIKDCFGVERINEYKGKGLLDVILVYGCAGAVLEQVKFYNVVGPCLCLNITSSLFYQFVFLIDVL
jgi:hypothetical protein